MYLKSSLADSSLNTQFPPLSLIINNIIYQMIYAAVTQIKSRAFYESFILIFYYLLNATYKGKKIIRIHYPCRNGV